MKTTKKIFAAFLAVMMIALMIPFSVSAAEATYSYTITGKDNYVFTVYKIADVDTTTFAYSNCASTEIETALTTKTSDSGIDTAALLTAANALTSTQLNGKSVGTITTATATTNTVGAGVYYVKATTTPASVTRVTNSVFALPYTDENGNVRTTISFNAGNKVHDDTPVITKVFTDTPDSTEISEFIGKDISFTLTSSVTGSASLKLQSYVITDTMSKGLDSAVDKVVSVKLTDDTLVDKTLVNNTDYTLAYNEGTDNNTLTITLKSDLLGSDDFYKYSDVEVIYTAKLNSSAVIGYAGNGNTNEALLDYKNSAGVDSSLETPQLKVYTFDIPVEKVDGNTEALITSSPAKFTLYTDAACTTVATNGAETETVDGVATFTGLKADTYYLKETAAPTGYNLNSSVFTVVISDTGVITVNGTAADKVTVNDYPLTVPQTGGVGTILFTIGGIALIACAGVLLFFLLRKKTSK